MLSNLSNPSFSSVGTLAAKEKADRRISASDWIYVMKTITDTRIIYITEADMKRLHPLFESTQNPRDDLRGLQAELEHACVVTPADVPADVITMNSKARLRDLNTGEEMVFTLVFPGDANVENDRISVVAPIGTAMLGQRVGDELEWEVPAGSVRLRVEEVLYQPEAAGHFYL
jgi:regulator of nucleoside diphosphate kinase